MVLAIGSAFSSAVGAGCDMFVLDSILSSPIYVSILITAIALIIAYMILDQDSLIKSLFKTGLYMFLSTFALVLLHNKYIMHENDVKSGDNTMDEAVTPLEERPGAGTATVVKVSPDLTNGQGEEGENWFLS